MPHDRSKIRLGQSLLMTLPPRYIRAVLQLGNRDERYAPVTRVDQCLVPAWRRAHRRLKPIAPVVMAADKHDRHVVLEGFAHRSRVAREG